MARWIALMRGVNVGGRHAVSMTDLRRHLAALGYERVSTYIQSGNLVFDHEQQSPQVLATELSADIEALTGFAVPTMVRDAAAWARVIAANPYPGVDHRTLHVLFLDHGSTGDAFAHLDLSRFEPETATIGHHELYLHMVNGMGTSKLAPALARVQVPTTARNWRTVLALSDLL